VLAAEVHDDPAAVALLDMLGCEASWDHSGNFVR
jgi:hypothetical protein